MRAIVEPGRGGRRRAGAGRGSRSAARVAGRAALALATLLTCGCECAEQRAPGAPASPPAPAERPVEAPEAPPVLAREVSFRTSDGATLSGTLRAAPQPGAPAVILVHQLGSTRAEWDAVVELLARPPALTTLAFDLRGHGESRAGPQGELDFHAFDDAQWAALPEDVRAAISFLREDPALQPSRIVGIGSSIGGSALLSASVDDPGLSALAVLSPGRAYRGIDALMPIPELRERPLLAIASEGEEPSAQTARDMARIAGRGEAWIVGGAEHGLAMVAAAPELPARLARFARDAVSQGP